MFTRHHVVCVSFILLVNSALPTTVTAQTIQDADTICRILGEAANEIAKLEKRDNVVWTVSVVGDEMVRARDYEAGLLLVKEKARPHYASLRLVHSIADHLIEQKRIDEAIDLIDLLRQIEDAGAEDFVYHAKEVTQTIVQIYASEGRYDEALQLINQMPVHFYCRDRISREQFRKNEIAARQSVIVDLAVMATSRGDRLLAHEWLEALPADIQRDAWPRMARAYARFGDARMAEDMLLRINEKWQSRTRHRVVEDLAFYGHVAEAVSLIDRLLPETGGPWRLNALAFTLRGERRREEPNEMTRSELLTQIMEEWKPEKPQIYPKAAGVVVDELIRQKNDQTALLFCADTYSYGSTFDLVGSPRPRLGGHAAEWLASGDRKRFQALLESMTPRQRASLYHHVVDHRQIRDNADLRKKLLADSLADLTEVMEQTDVEAHAGMINSVIDKCLELDDPERALQLVEQLGNSENHGWYIATAAAALLRKNPNAETNRRIDALLEDHDVNSGFTALLMARLHLGFHQSAGELIDRCPENQRREFLTRACYEAVGKQNPDELFKLMRERYGEEAFQNDSHWASWLYQLPPDARYETLKLFLEYFPNDHHGNGFYASALAERGAVEAAMKQRRKADRLAERNHLDDVAKKLCEAGKERELLKYLASQFHSRQDRETALRWICPALAKTDYEQAIKLAREITDPKMKAITLGYTASSMLDERIGPVEK